MNYDHSMADGAVTLRELARTHVCLAIGLILGLTLGLTHAVAQEMSWDDRMWAGRQAYQRGDYGQAEQHWLDGLEAAKKFGPDSPRLAVSLNPDCPDGLLN